MLFNGMRVQRWDMLFHSGPTKAEAMDGKRMGYRRSESSDEGWCEQMPIVSPS